MGHRRKQAEKDLTGRFNVFGKDLNVREMVELSGHDEGTVRARLTSGMVPEEVVAKPLTPGEYLAIAHREKRASMLTFLAFKELLQREHIRSRGDYTKRRLRERWTTAPSLPNLFYRDEGWTNWKTLLDEIYIGTGLAHEVRIPKGDIAGCKFGRLTAEEEVEPSIEKNGGRARRYRCRCDCGTIRIVRMSGLLRGTSQSCGCLKIERQKEHTKQATLARHMAEDVTGRQFGALTALRRSEERVSVWICQCLCGKEAEFEYAALMVENNTSCGCHIWARMKHLASGKKFDVFGEQLTILEISELIGKPEGYVRYRLSRYGSVSDVFSQEDRRAASNRIRLRSDVDGTFVKGGA